MKITRTVLGTVLALHLAVGAFLVARNTAQAAPPEWFDCRPTAVFETGGQIQVSCSNSQSGVSWVAISTSSPAGQVARFLSLANSALLSGRIFRAFVTTDTCGFAACRIASAWGLYTL